MYPRRFSRIIAEKAVEKVEKSQHRNLILIIGSLGFGLLMLVVAMMNIFSEATPDPTTRWIGVIICILLSFLSFSIGIVLWSQKKEENKDLP